MSQQYHDESWKSIGAIGIYWILLYSSMIQTGDQIFNFILLLVIHGEQVPLYTDYQGLILESAYNSDNSFLIQEIWNTFLNMTQKNLSRQTQTFSQVFIIFLEIINNGEFIVNLRHLCYLMQHDSQSAFEEKILEFCESMRNSPIEHHFQSLFYPRLYAICKNCRSKIYDDQFLKERKTCSKCIRFDSGTSSDFDGDDDD
jgi:hypothetical protein